VGGDAHGTGHALTGTGEAQATMALTVIMVLLFGSAIAIPAVWSVVGLARGKPGSWPAFAGAIWGVLLLLVTIAGSAAGWGDGADAEGAVVCRSADTVQERDCQPGVWKPEDGKPSGCAPLYRGKLDGDIPSAAYCRAGTTPVYSFCEHFRTGGVKQPWATWSDLSFVAAGVWLLWLFQYFGKPGTTSGGGTTISLTADNPIITIGWLSLTYAFIVIFMGPPSQWYHASMKAWAGWFDAMSVVAWLMFNAVYVSFMACFSMWGHGRGAARTVTVMLVWGGLVFVLGLIGALAPRHHLVLYLVSGGAWGVAEVACLIAAKVGDPQYRRNGWLFGANAALLALTMGLWLMFNDSVIAPTTCQGREGFPGHALFHILASFSTVLAFFSFASERRV
jgi:hypothetical protein